MSKQNSGKSLRNAKPRYDVLRASSPYDGAPVGYLVTAKDDPDTLVAFVGEGKGARELALRVAENPKAMDGSDAVDLRGAGEDREMPPEVYGLVCLPLDAKPGDVPVRPRPYCRFGFEFALSQHVLRRFGDERRRKAPYAVVCVTDPEGEEFFYDREPEHPDPLARQVARLPYVPAMLLRTKSAA